MSEEKTYSNKFIWEAVSSEFTLSARDDQPAPVPNKAEVVEASQPLAEDLIGEISKRCLDNGCTITIDKYFIDVFYFEKVKSWIQHGQIHDFYYATYRTHIWFGMDFTTDPEVYNLESPLFISSWFILAIGLSITACIVAATGISPFLQNLSTTKKSHQKIVEYYDEEGNLVKKVIDEQTEEGAGQQVANWLGVLAIVIVILAFLWFFIKEKPYKTRRKRRK